MINSLLYGLGAFDVPFQLIMGILLVLGGIPFTVLKNMDDKVRGAILKALKFQMAFEALLPPLLALAIVAIGTDIARRQSDPPTREGVWAVVIGALMLITVVATWRFFFHYARKTAIVSNLQKQILQKWKKEREIDEETLLTLIEMGNQSKLSEDKQLVLGALAGLVEHVCGDAAYQGDSLENLITKLVEILAFDTSSGNCKNLRTAADILRMILKTAAPERRTTDLIYAMRVLCDLSRGAIEYLGRLAEIESMLMGFIESLSLTATRFPASTTLVTQVLFEIGVTAKEKGQTLIAVAALDKLMHLVEANHPASGELVADALGLASHFWMDGEVSKKYITQRIKNAKSDLEQGLRKSLEAARDHCILTTQFKTAENINRMLASL